MPDIKILVVAEDSTIVSDLNTIVTELEYNLIGIVNTSDELQKRIGIDNPNLILMDIKINEGLKRIDWVKKIQKKYPVGVIFMINPEDQNYFIQEKEMENFEYLIKPFSKLTLQSKIELDMLKMPHSDYPSSKEIDRDKKCNEGMILENCVFIKRNNILEKVEINDIEFIQSEGNYCVISTEKKKYALKMSLIKVRKMLDCHQFLRVNKRHIINMSLISSIDLSTNQIKINEVSFSIGRTYKEGLLKRLKTLS
ncbi:MAG: LytR/AlgR family response regulator transcription factor [Saprospiraceae bacterium]